MVLVDSSPWIDFFSGRASPEASRLQGWLEQGRPVAVNGIVLQEVLQGARTDGDFGRVRARLSLLPFLRADRDVHAEAARLSRRARARGWTVPAADALIAATAVAHRASVLTRDRADFHALARVSKLEVVLC
jgi:hypothetical protein